MKKIIILFVFFSISFDLFSQVQSLVWREGPTSCLKFSQPSNSDIPLPFEENVNNLEKDFYGYSIFTDSYGDIKYYIGADSAYIEGINYDISALNIADYPQSMLVLDNMSLPNFYFVDTSGSFISTNNILSILDLDTISNEAVCPKFAVSIKGSDTIFALHEKSGSNYIFYIKNGLNTSSFELASNNYTHPESGFFKSSTNGLYLASSYPDENALDIINIAGTSSSLNTTLYGHAFNALEFSPFVNTSSDIEEILYAADQHSIYQIYIRSGGIVEINDDPVAYSSFPIIDMQVSADGRIFVAKQDGSIGVIEVPELEGPDCNYFDDFIQTTEQIHPFPNVAKQSYADYTTFSWNPNIIVQNGNVNFSFKDYSMVDSAKWYIDGDYVSDYQLDTSFSDIGIHEIKSKVYYNTTQRLYWDSVTFIKHINVKSLLDDIIICDTTQGVDLVCNYIDTATFNWNRIVDNISVWNTTVSGSNSIHVNHPGIYTVEVLDGSNTLFDTANVIYFEPYFEYVPDTFVIGDTMTAQVELNVIPPGAIDPDDFNYDWYLNGSPIGSGIDLMMIDVIFNDIGQNILTVDASILGCQHSVSQYVQITGPSAQYHLDKHYFTVCDTASDSTLKIIPTPSTDYIITWHLPNGTTITDDNEIQVHTPGKYIVEIIDPNSIYHRDSCIVHYDLCENLNIDATVNGLPASTFCDQTDSYSFIADITDVDTICYTDDSFWDYSWDFDDGNIISGNFDVENYNFPEPGFYNVNFFLVDAKGCSHSASVTVITTVSNDSTVTINASEKDLYGEYIIDIGQMGLFEQIIPKKSFYKVDFDQIIPSGISYYSIPVDASINSSIDLDQVKIMLNIALAGPFDFTIFTPYGESASLLHYSGNDKPLFGFPVLGYSGIQKAITQTYFLKSDGYDFDDYISTADSTNYYYQPNDSTALGTFYHLAPLTEFNMQNTLSNVQVGGNWTLQITNNNPGYLKSIGIMFPPNFAEISILPDSVICSDDYGYTYKTNYENKLFLKYLGIDQVKYNCKAYYKGCSVDKVLVVNFPKEPDTFTPNGDGINDYWKPVSFNSNADIIIMDKNGTIVDEFNTNDRPEGWAGNYSNGMIAPNDSYWAIILLKDGTVVKKVVNIIR